MNEWKNEVDMLRAFISEILQYGTLGPKTRKEIAKGLIASYNRTRKGGVK